MMPNKAERRLSAHILVFKTGAVVAMSWTIWYARERCDVSWGQLVALSAGVVVATMLLVLARGAAVMRDGSEKWRG